MFQGSKTKPTLEVPMRQQMTMMEMKRKEAALNTWSEKDVQDSVTAAPKALLPTDISGLDAAVFTKR